MKTSKENIRKELEELNATFLLTHNKKNVEVPSNIHEEIINSLNQLNKKQQISKVRKMIYYVSGIAATLVLGLYIFSIIPANENTNQISWENVSEAEILLYIEEDLTNYTEEDLYALVNTENSENLFDNSGITNDFLEEYIFNQLNEEIQLEDLL